MRTKQIQWINTPVITEAIFRYEKGLLPNSMKLWLEQVLEIDSKTLLNNSRENPKTIRTTKFLRQP